ncbi:Glyoxylate pathway regulator [Leucoagaricus sp. SymC.cos]|nr:Glyoxylate pathway regulator [Leucoagaricus sp. SymC.cos]
MNSLPSTPDLSSHVDPISGKPERAKTTGRKKNKRGFQTPCSAVDEVRHAVKVLGDYAKDYLSAFVGAYIGSNKKETSAKYPSMEEPSGSHIGVGSLPGKVSEPAVATLPEEKAGKRFNVMIIPDSGPMSCTNCGAFPPSDKLPTSSVGSLPGTPNELDIAHLPDERQLATGILVPPGLNKPHATPQQRRGLGQVSRDPSMITVSGEEVEDLLQQEGTRPRTLKYDPGRKSSSKGHSRSRTPKSGSVTPKKGAERESLAQDVVQAPSGSVVDRLLKDLDQLDVSSDEADHQLLNAELPAAQHVQTAEPPLAVQPHDHPGHRRAHSHPTHSPIIPKHVPAHFDETIGPLPNQVEIRGNKELPSMEKPGGSRFGVGSLPGQQDEVRVAEPPDEKVLPLSVPGPGRTSVPSHKFLFHPVSYTLKYVGQHHLLGATDMPSAPGVALGMYRPHDRPVQQPTTGKRQLVLTDCEARPGCGPLPSVFLWLFYVVGTPGVKNETAIVGMGLFVGGLAQFMADMWEFPCGNIYGSAFFTLYGTFWISYATSLLVLHVNTFNTESPQE